MTVFRLALPKYRNKNNKSFRHLMTQCQKVKAKRMYRTILMTLKKNEAVQYNKDTRIIARKLAD